MTSNTWHAWTILPAARLQLCLASKERKRKAKKQGPRADPHLWEELQEASTCLFPHSQADWREVAVEMVQGVLVVGGLKRRGLEPEYSRAGIVRQHLE